MTHHKRDCELIAEANLVTCKRYSTFNLAYYLFNCHMLFIFKLFYFAFVGE